MRQQRGVGNVILGGKFQANTSGGYLEGDDGAGNGLAALGGALAPKRPMGKGGIWVLKLMTEFSSLKQFP
jgi:hypothetical protein